MAYYILHTYMYLVGHGVLFFSANISEELSKSSACNFIKKETLAFKKTKQML